MMMPVPTEPVIAIAQGAVQLEQMQHNIIMFVCMYIIIQHILSIVRTIETTQ